MINKYGQSLPLKEHVRALENIKSPDRGQYIQDALQELGIETSLQECRRPKIKNIIVDFSPGSENQLLFSAHYDVVKGSAGANDNASGVSVLLGLCQKLKNIRVPVRVVFFDREEAWLRTPLLRLGLLGSLYYVWTLNARKISAVYNLEFCGLGDYLIIWPVRDKKAELPALERIASAARQLALPFKSIHVPLMLFSSDHLSFRLRGIPDAYTLSLLPKSQIQVLEQQLANLNLWKILGRGRFTLPEPLSFIHTDKDTSLQISENSLELMLSLLLQLTTS
jgi:Zn-dependent M28 family amino/carboxypeptidase